MLQVTPRQRLTLVLRQAKVRLALLQAEARCRLKLRPRLVLPQNLWPGHISTEIYLKSTQEPVEAKELPIDARLFEARRLLADQPRSLFTDTCNV